MVGETRFIIRAEMLYCNVFKVKNIDIASYSRTTPQPDRPQPVVRSVHIVGSLVYFEYVSVIKYAPFLMKKSSAH